MAWVTFVRYLITLNYGNTCEVNKGKDSEEGIVL